ncbi:YdcF family protein [Stutzerimonas nitrititolerans]|uniref:YdcF family protein n=1 Tax=Stutzerimonas nitrititolerans TaxID=2482751 RepID=UPI0015E3795A|nr:YdcF family protein [Stutzerimonas nitrititolerans]MBA1233882.1 YdcF family protein [Stutzerimonas stutzeri]
MPIRYFFKHLLLPPGGLLLLLLAAWWLRRRAPRLSALCFVAGLGGLWLMSLPVMVQWAAQALEREPAIPEAQWASLREQAQAIVVLGAGRERADLAWQTDQPGHIALERLRYAARLAKATKLPILASGGLHYGQPPSEAALAAETLQRDFATPIRWREERSRTTWENAVHSAAMLKAEGIERIVLVTSAAHMPRSRWCFEQNGMTVIAAPVGFLGVPNGRPLGGWMPEAKAVWQSGQLLNEAVGMLVYPLVYAGVAE